MTKSSRKLFRDARDNFLQKFADHISKMSSDALVDRPFSGIMYLEFNQRLGDLPITDVLDYEITIHMAEAVRSRSNRPPLRASTSGRDAKLHERLCEADRDCRNVVLIITSPLDFYQLCEVMSPSSLQLERQFDAFLTNALSEGVKHAESN
jgi:hypothetical protein